MTFWWVSINRFSSFPETCQKKWEITWAYRSWWEMLETKYLGDKLKTIISFKQSISQFQPNDSYRFSHTIWGMSHYATHKVWVSIFSWIKLLNIDLLAGLFRNQKWIFSKCFLLLSVFHLLGYCFRHYVDS